MCLQVACNTRWNGIILLAKQDGTRLFSLLNKMEQDYSAQHMWQCGDHPVKCQNTGGISRVHRDVQYIRGYHDACGEYYEYIGVFNINQKLS